MRISSKGADVWDFIICDPKQWLLHIGEEYSKILGDFNISSPPTDMENERTVYLEKKNFAYFILELMHSYLLQSFNKNQKKS